MVKALSYVDSSPLESLPNLVVVLVGWIKLALIQKNQYLDIKYLFNHVFLDCIHHFLFTNLHSNALIY